MENKKVRFTWIDALIIIVVVVCLIIGANVFGIIKINKIASGDNVNIRLEMELVNMEDRVKDELLKSNGEEFTISDKSSTKFTLKNVEANPAKVLAFNAIDSKYILAQKTENWDIKVILEGKATETEKAIDIDGFTVKVGSKLVLKNSFISPSGYATNIEILK